MPTSTGTFIDPKFIPIIDVEKIKEIGFERQAVDYAQQQQKLRRTLAKSIDQHGEDTQAYWAESAFDSFSYGEPNRWVKTLWISKYAASYGIPRLSPIISEEYFELAKALNQIPQSDTKPFYRFENGEQVGAFLSEHPELDDFIQNSRFHLEQYFGGVATFYIEHLVDPEVPKDKGSLFIIISTALPVDEAMGRLHQLDEEWYLPQAGDIGNLINFNLEFYEL